MADLKIDFDDGILYEVTPDRRPAGGVTLKKDPDTGADVFMYKRKPGIYYSYNGTEVSRTMAKRAGFDVDFLESERQKQLRMADFQANWERQNATQQKQTIAEQGEYKLVFIRGGGYYVEHKDGTVMTANTRAPTEQMGRDWLADFAGVEVKPDDNVSELDGQGVGGTDRRSDPNGDPDRIVRKPGRPKTTVSA